MALNSYLSIITLNVNGLNAPIRDTGYQIGQKSKKCCLQETHFRPKDTSRLKVRGWKTIYHANGQKKAGVTILISDKLDYKPKSIIRDEEGHYIILKGYIQKEDLTILNIYAPNIRTTNYISQLITKSKKHIDNNTIIVGDFNTPLTQMDGSSKQKIKKEIKALNDTLDQMDFTDIFRTFHPKATEFFSGAHGTFSRIDRILGHKSGLK